MRFSQAKLLLTFGLCWLPALISGHLLQSASEAYGEDTQGTLPIVNQLRLGLQVLLPVLSTYVIFLTPGMLLSLALNCARSPARWLLTGLALSLVTLSPTVVLSQLFFGAPILGTAFIALTALVSLLTLAVLLWRSRDGLVTRWPCRTPEQNWRFSETAALVALLVLILAPKIFWESLNGDGAHAFESVRLLLYRPLPFWPLDAGDVAAFPGMTSLLFLYPLSWFVRVLGDCEASVRLPVLLYVGILYTVVLELIDHGRPESAGPACRVLVACGLVTFTMILAFSATYDPYSADLALPAAQDTFYLICFLGFVICYLEESVRWLYVFGAMTYFSSPMGLLLLGLWCATTCLVCRPLPRRQIGHTVLLLALCVGFSAIGSPVLRAAGLPSPGYEYGARRLVGYVRYLQWGDWGRLAYFVLPSGFAPLLLVLAWRRQDSTSRCVSLLSASEFVFFFVQAYISLHYFVPAMVLPLISFWRTIVRLDVGSRRRWQIFATAGGMVGLLSATPTDWRVHRGGWVLGESIWNRLPGYAEMAPYYFRGIQLFEHIVPVDWDARVPEGSFGGSPLVWSYYSQRAAKYGRKKFNYILQPDYEPAPQGARLMIRAQGAALYVVNLSVLAEHRALRYPSPPGRRWYAVQRWMLFRGAPPPADSGVVVFDLLSYLRRLRTGVGF